MKHSAATARDPWTAVLAMPVWGSCASAFLLIWGQSDVLFTALQVPRSGLLGVAGHEAGHQAFGSDRMLPEGSSSCTQCACVML